MKYKLLLGVAFILNVLGDEDQVLLLNDGNFEHLTQAATGATTGDWFVLMLVLEIFCSLSKDLKLFIL